MAVYTKDSALTDQQIAELRESADNQNEFILSILKRTGQGYAIFEMIDLTGIHYSSVNRALSSMSSKKNMRGYARFSDDCGRMPVVKSKEKSVYNEETGKNCCTYWYNEDYGKPCEGQQKLEF